MKGASKAYSSLIKNRFKQCEKINALNEFNSKIT